VTTRMTVQRLGRVIADVDEHEATGNDAPVERSRPTAPQIEPADDPARGGPLRSRWVTAARA
jgi:hypothetical protein